MDGWGSSLAVTKTTLTADGAGIHVGAAAAALDSAEASEGGSASLRGPTFSGGLLYTILGQHWPCTDQPYNNSWHLSGTDKVSTEIAKTQGPSRLSETIKTKRLQWMLLICLLMRLNQAIQAQLHGDMTVIITMT